MHEYSEIDLSKASFEWDEQKDQINFTKHGIHFRTAAKVFLDPNKLIRKARNILRNSDTIFSERFARFCSWSVPSGRTT